MDTIYTIGHSTHSIARLIELLRAHSITAVCDVRSKPYSRLNPQFNREALKSALAGASIQYVFLGAELGARSEDPECYCNGQVQFDLLAKTELFKAGIQRVISGAGKYRVALLCAEKEPLDCHRTILVSRVLSESGVLVKHIHSDGRSEEHSNALKRLVGTLRLPPSDMFRAEEVVVREAYALQARQIAYQKKDTFDSQQGEQQAPRDVAEGRT